MEARRRMSTATFEREWLEAKEEVRLLIEQGKEVLSIGTKADIRLDRLYEGVIGHEVPDIDTLAERRVRRVG